MYRGEIMGLEGPSKLYETGAGSITIRALTHIETLSASGNRQPRSAIVVTELPYMVNKVSGGTHQHHHECYWLSGFDHDFVP